MRQYQAGTISEGNSTVVPLGISETFTGVEEWNPQSDMMVTLKTDQDGTLYVDLGIEPGVYDTSIPFKVEAGVGEFHTVVKGTRYSRIRLVNGTSAQTYMRLQTEYGLFRKPNKAMNSSLRGDDDAAAVRPTHFQYEAALGRRAGVTTWNKFGYNEDVDSGTEIVAEFGGTFAPLAAASTLSIISSSTDDDDGGIGATGIVVYGVDANWDSQIEVVTMNGTTPVVTTTTWLGINRISVFLAGTAQQNVGKITLTSVTGTLIQATMPIGEGTSQQCIFFVRNNHTALLDFMLLNAEKLSGGGTPKVTFKCWVFSAVSNAKYEVFRHLIDTGAGDGTLILSPTQPFVIGEKSAFWIDATTDTNDTHVTGRVSLVEVAD